MGQLTSALRGTWNGFWAIALLFLGAAPAGAQQLRFFAKPYEVFEGDAVVFTYLDGVATVHLADIQSWKWDFDGDGVWDEEKTVGVNDVTIAQINATWYALYNNVIAAGGNYVVTPKLQVTTFGNQTITQTGVTEDVFGADNSVDPSFAVKKRSVGDANIIVNFSANPRLAGPGELVRLYSAVTFAEGKSGQITAYHWGLGGGTGDASNPNPTATYAANGTYNVSLYVNYTLTGAATSYTSPTETKRDFIRILTVPGDLQLGRAYRRGFPETYNWDDIINAYSALGAGQDRYVYFHHFEDAFFAKQNDMVTPAGKADATNRRLMAETVNELLQGQTLIANQRLIEALRIKYPRITNYDPAHPPETLPVPAGARTETAAIDIALLDYQLPIAYAAAAIQLYGPDILRAKAAPGTEPFPQFPLYLTFLDPSLSQAPIPIKNEYWQLTSALERMELGRVEKAKKLFRLSAQDATARGESKEECKTAGMQAYLGMALLAAGQTENDFQQNEGSALLAHIKNARDLFNTINARLNPLGNDGSFIPNESFAATYQDATDAVASAREAEINARQETRTYDRYQADLRNEQLAQRNSYITPLKLLTSIDPALYNNLQTVDDQTDFRNVVNSRVNALIKSYPNGNSASVGELGSNVIALLDAGQGVDKAKNDLVNLFKRVDIAKWGNDSVSARIKLATVELTAVDMLIGISDGLIGFNLPSETGGGTPTAIAGGVLKGIEASAKDLIQAIETMSINDIKLEQEIRGTLLEVGNLGIAIDRANNQVRQTQLALDNQLAKMDRLIVDLSHTRETAENLYFQDPSFRVVVSQAERRADNELDFAIDKLYRLAKTLQYEWTEGYGNPVTIPVSSSEPASLENPLFDKFTTTDSLFFIRGADESKDYLDALKAWDSKLRRINVTSVRGPNHSGPITAEPISFREQILNLVPDPTRNFTLSDSITAFRNYLETKRTANFYNVANPSLELQFTTTIEDNRFFPATGSRWNMRIASIAADIYSDSGFSDKQVAEIDLIQTGTVSMRRFFASPPLADDLYRLTFNASDLNRTAFAVAFPCRINGATAGRPLAEFDNLGLADRPVAATKWILRINTENPTNRNINFSKIKDIVLRFTYTYGNPPEFTGF